MGPMLKLTTDEQPGTNTPDRRRRDRLVSDTAAWVFPATGRAAHSGPTEELGWEVRVHDLSRYGVGFVTTSSISAGSTHRLRIGRGPMHRARLVRVVVCRQTAPNLYLVGAEFLDSGHKPMAKARKVKAA